MAKDRKKSELLEAIHEVMSYLKYFLFDLLVLLKLHFCAYKLHYRIKYELLLDTQMNTWVDHTV